MKAKRILKKLNYVPRWAWYLLSLSVGGPFGVLAVYVVFHALEKAAKDEAEEESFSWGAHSDYRGASRQQGYPSGTYQDEECTVTDEEDVSARWQRTEASARRAGYNDQSEAYEAYADEDDGAYDDVEAATADTGDPACNEVIAEVRDSLRAIRRANDLIPDPALSAQINSIENSCRQILQILEQRPQMLSELRTFLRYYLPTTLKLLDARAKLENTASTPKARQVRARIGEALGVIDTAFRKQVEALDEYRFIDLESEMDVLRDMLRADGLVDEQSAAPKGQTLGGY